MGSSRITSRQSAPVVSGWAIALLVLLAAAGPSAQEEDPSAHSSPYQAEFEYTVGDDLDPSVVIEGVRWSLIRMAVRGDREPEAGKRIPVDLTLGFSNDRSETVTLHVALLLEDDTGGLLDQLECEPIRLGAGRSKELSQKHRVWGDALLGARLIYVDLSVE
jgi:hypothetical protein